MKSTVGFKGIQQLIDQVTLLDHSVKHIGSILIFQNTSLQTRHQIFRVTLQC